MRQPYGMYALMRTDGTSKGMAKAINKSLKHMLKKLVKTAGNSIEWETFQIILKKDELDTYHIPLDGDYFLGCKFWADHE